MGKITGFLEYQRLNEAEEPADARKKHYKEFVARLADQDAKVQGARCMDCGIPFCMSGCPVNNIIPDFNDLVYQQDWKSAIETLHSTNNFPEFTGRICPAPCEEACTLRINNDPVGIKSIEHAIIDKAWEEGWVNPMPSPVKTGKKVAVIGSGPAGLACAQQLARVGHQVVLFEKNDRVGGLLRYGIPDFKMEKWLIDRRVDQMRAEGVEIRTGHVVGKAPAGAGSAAPKEVDPQALLAEFDAVVLSGGAEAARDLPIPGRELDGVHFAMEFLPLQNRRVAGDEGVAPLWATDKHVVVIGGGDTGSDCVGTSNRHGAKSVTQFEVMPMPPDPERNPVWPYWPTRLRTSSSQKEVASDPRNWSIATKKFIGEKGKIKALTTVKLEWKDGKMSEIAGSETTIPADLVLLAMGFVSPVQGVLDAFNIDKDARGNAKASVDDLPDGTKAYATTVPKVFAAGDMRRGQSLVVWAIREGRQCARAVDEFLMGSSQLPR